MRLIDQIAAEIKKRKGVSLMSTCKDAGVDYQTVRRAIKDGSGITESTLMKLQETLGMVLILVNKDVIAPKSMEDVINKLNKALKDPSYRMSWVANIAMAYIDNENWWRKENNKIGKYLNNEDRHAIANESAEYFLKQLSR